MESIRYFTNLSKLTIRLKRYGLNLKLNLKPKILNLNKKYRNGIDEKEISTKGKAKEKRKKRRSKSRSSRNPPMVFLWRSATLNSRRLKNHSLRSIYNGT